MAWRSGFLVAIVCIGSFTAGLPKAESWELKLHGTFTWKYELLGQMGPSGFFGPHDTDRSTFNLHQMNFYAGHNVGFDRTVSGLDAVAQTQYMTLNMKFRLNPAVLAEGEYYVGSWASTSQPFGTTQYQQQFEAQADLVRSEYRTYEFEGVKRAFSPGYWNWFRARVKLPWGTLAYGKRPRRAAMGLMLNAENSSSESVSLTVPYGPFLFSMGFYPSRAGPENYYHIADRSNIRPVNASVGMRYFSGPLQIGFNHGLAFRHRGGERNLGLLPRNAENYWSHEREDHNTWCHLAYFNGSFFLNAEYGRRFRRVIRSSPFSQRLYRDQEFETWGIETGVLVGPAKMSLLLVSVPGPDRRGNGAGGFNQNGVFKDNSMEACPDDVSNTGVFIPYTFLMVYNYSVGTPANPPSNEGNLDGAMGYGARLDYALAANLNVFGTFFYATRPYTGYGWGYLSPLRTWGTGNVWTATTTGEVARVVGGARENNTRQRLTTAGSPTIPDDALGWEVDAGFDWKLLESFTLRCTFAYWQPGDWFKYACVSLANPGWRAPTAANRWGTDPTRSIDQVFGLQVRMLMDF